MLKKINEKVNKKMNMNVLLTGVLIVGLLTGCTNNSTSNESSSKASDKSSLVSKKNKSNSDKSDKKNETDGDKTDLNQVDFKSYLKSNLKPIFIPQQLPTVKTGFLNLHTNVENSGKSKSYTLNFSDQQKKPDNNLTDEKLIVKYQEQELSQAEIKNQINWIAPETGLPQIDLGYSIKATTQGAAGSTYLNWNEGKWSITIRSSNQTSNSNQKAQDLAKKLVAYFEKNALPAPVTNGSIKIEQEGSDNQKIQIKFDHEQKLITVNGPDVFTVLNFATNLR